MCANAPGSILEDLDELNTMSEGLYTIYEKFGGGMAEEYKITISAPVDVTVYDETGQVVGRVVDNFPDYSVANGLRIVVGEGTAVSGDGTEAGFAAGESAAARTIYVNDPDLYSITLSGNNDGMMDIEVSYTNDDYTQISSYRNVPFTAGSILAFDVSEDSAKSGNFTPLYGIEEGIESSPKMEIEPEIKRYELTVYPCLESQEGTIFMTAEGGYAMEGVYEPGTELRPLVVVEEGYCFDGFFINAGCTIPYTDTKMPSSALVLYAKFHADLSGITITRQPVSAEYECGDAAEPLTVEAIGSGSLTYQWYRFTQTGEAQTENTEETGQVALSAQAIEGATGSRYFPDTSAVGETWYFVRIFAHAGSEEVSTDSESVLVKVSEKIYTYYGECLEGLTWGIDGNGTLVISGNGSLDGYSNEEAPWYPYKDEIYAVVVEEGIETVGNNAFKGLSQVRTATIASSVTTMGSGVLAGCESLSELTIPFIGSNRTANGTKEAVFGYIFGKAQTGTLQYYSRNDSSLSGYYYAIPSSLRKIQVTDADVLPFGAFCNCSSLSEVILNNGISTISEYAIAGCASLVGLAIPDTVQEIGEYALKGCDSLSELTIPFVGSNRTVNGTYNAALGYIFGRTSASQANYYLQYTIRNGDSISGYGYAIPDSLVHVTLSNANQIPFGAFYGLTQIQEVSINYGVTAIDEFAFHDCSSLSDVYYGGSKSQWDVVAVGNGNESLLNASMHYAIEDISLPDQPDYILPGFLTEIAQEAFAGSGCTYAVLPQGIIRIGQRAFADCVNLVAIQLPESITEISQDAFQGVPDGLVLVGIPGSYAEAYAMQNGFQFLARE